MCRLFGILWLVEAGVALYFLIWLLNVLVGGDWHRQLVLHVRRPTGGGFKSTASIRLLIGFGDIGILKDRRRDV